MTDIKYKKADLEGKFGVEVAIEVFEVVDADQT